MLCHQRLGLLGFHLHGPATPVELLPDVGDTESSTRAFDQSQTQTLFQPGDAPAQLRFRLVERPSSRRKPAMSHDLGVGVYSASKAAVRNFARSWILDLKERQIRVNVVSPGLTDTAGVEKLFGGGDQADGVKTAFTEEIPSGRIGKPEEIASAVLFLASAEAGFVNGIELFVDGGLNQV